MSNVSAYPDFPFVQELPKREQKKVASVWDQIQEIKRAIEDKGLLIPAPMAAELLGLSRQRVHMFASEKRLEAVYVNGHPFITEASLVEFAKVERKNGRPFKAPTLKESLGMAKRALKK